MSERSRPIRLLLETSTTLASGLIVGVTLLLEPRTTWTRRLVRQLGALLKGGSGAGCVGRHEGTPRGMARRPVSAPWPYSLGDQEGAGPLRAAPWWCSLGIHMGEAGPSAMAARIAEGRSCLKYLRRNTFSPETRQSRRIRRLLEISITLTSCASPDAATLGMPARD